MTGVFFIWNESTSGTHLTWFGKSCVSDPKTKKFGKNKPDFPPPFRRGLIFLLLNVVGEEEQRRVSGSDGRWAGWLSRSPFLVGERPSHGGCLHHSPPTQRQTQGPPPMGWDGCLLALWVSCPGKTVRDAGRLLEPQRSKTYTCARLAWVTRANAGTLLCGVGYRKQATGTPPNSPTYWDTQVMHLIWVNPRVKIRCM